MNRAGTPIDRVGGRTAAFLLGATLLACLARGAAADAPARPAPAPAATVAPSVAPAAAPSVAPAAAPSAAPRASLVQRVALKGGPVEIEVGFDADQRAWGAYHLRQAAAYLPAVEAFLGVGLHEVLPGFLGPHPSRPAASPVSKDPAAPFRVRIEGQRRVLLNGSWIGAYNNTASLFPGDRAIFVEYNLTPLGAPSLIFHELGHFWLYDSAGVTRPTEPGKGGASWFNEGAVAVLPLAVVEAGLLPLTPWECASVGEHMGLRRVPFQVDAPIEEDLRPRGGPLLLLFYQKSFLSHLLVRRSLGPARYRALLASAARSPGALYSADGVLALLRAQRPLPWQKLLGGWVYRGPYGPVAPAAFQQAAIRPDGTVALPGDALH